jgi:hypothetical protein
MHTQRKRLVNYITLYYKRNSQIIKNPNNLMARCYNKEQHTYLCPGLSSSRTGHRPADT